jgi:hypothetical protein
MAHVRESSVVGWMLLRGCHDPARPFWIDFPELVTLDGSRDSEIRLATRWQM